MTSYRDIGRDFEFEFDIGSLYEYETPLRSATVLPKVDFVSLDRFPQRSDSVPNALNDILTRIGHLVAASFKIGTGITEVELGGYVDTTGSDTRSGQDLGKLRAEAVRIKLVKEMDKAVRGTSSNVRFIISSNPTAPILTSEHALNRRVVVRLPATCQVFFAEYDLQSYPNPLIGFHAHPNIIDKQARLNSVTFVKQELDARLNARAKLALSGKVLSATDAVLSARKDASRDDVARYRETVKNAAIDLSAMQLNLFGKYHSGRGGFSPESLMACMLKFANGEMRSPHSHFEQGKNRGREEFAVGEPDSNHVFMFAEFALLCLDWNIAPLTTMWARALPALVAPQEVFIYVYREKPRLPPPPVDAPLPRVSEGNAAIVTHDLSKFAGKNFKPINGSQTKGVGQSDAKRMAELMAKYSGMMAAESLRAAMGNNLRRAQTLT